MFISRTAGRLSIDLRGDVGGDLIHRYRNVRRNQQTLIGENLHLPVELLALLLNILLLLLDLILENLLLVTLFF